MDDYRKLTEAFVRLTKSSQHYTHLAKVEQVAGITCRVTLLDSHEELESVRLLAVEDDSITDFFVTVPQVGSIVAISPMGPDGHVYRVTSFSKVDQLKFVKGNTSVVVDGEDISFHSGGKVVFKNSETSLKDLLESIVEAIQTLSVGTNVGPSQPPLPPTLNKCTALTEDISKLFKQ